MVCTKYTPVNYYETLSYDVIKNTVIAWASTENIFNGYNDNCRIKEKGKI